MSSFLRRISFSSSPKPDNLLQSAINMEKSDEEDRLAEINKNFTQRDAETIAPQMVSDMNWEVFNERVLDCGCGTGKIGFAHILPQVYIHDSHLYAIDTLESNVSYASMKYPHPSVTYAQGDIMADNFPFKYTIFDKIFAIHGLQSVKDYRTALKRFFDFLKPGGYLGLTFATNIFSDWLNQELSKDEKWMEYFQNLTENPSKDNNPDASEHQESFQLLFHGNCTSLGFEVVKIKTEAMEYTFPSLEKAVVYYISTSPYVKSIPAELQDPFEQDCLEKMMNKFKILDIADPYPITYDLLTVIARKPGQPSQTKVDKSQRKQRLSLP